MNTRDIGQQKAFEYLRQNLDIDPETPIAKTTLLQVATCIFLSGWTYGLQDAQRCYHQGVSDAQTDEQIRIGFKQLKRILQSATVPGKSRG